MQQELKSMKSNPGGKFLLRIPISLHVKLVELAAKNLSSLNRYCTMILAEKVGAIEADEQKEKEKMETTMEKYIATDQS